MTRDDVVKQVLSRVKLAAGEDVKACEVLEKWLSLYPVHFKFGPASVQAGVRLIEREIVALRSAATRGGKG